MEEGYRLEDWMDLPTEGVTNVISPSRVANILNALAVLTINVEGDDPSVPEVSRIEHPVEAQPVMSVSVPL